MNSIHFFISIKGFKISAPIAAALLASSSVANPLIIFCRLTGGGVGGRDAGGVGGLLKLLCCKLGTEARVRDKVMLL